MARPHVSNTTKRIVLSLTIMLLLGLTTIVVFKRHTVVYYGERWARRFETPNLKWVTADPSEEGLDPAVLDDLRDNLEERGTEAFVVIRGNRIVFEWYAWGSGPNRKHGLAAMAKAVTGSMALLVALSDNRIQLDEPASKYIPQWRNDPVRSKILIRDLASHSSGLDDVDFFAGERNQLQGWKKKYYENRGERFKRAIEEAPVLFPPGSQFRYAGLGYYALAYAVTVSLQGTAQPDIMTLLRERIMHPLAIPDSDWGLSYGESYDVDGMKLYAFGSGASYTARAVARIGQLALDQGRWGNKTLFDAYWLRQIVDAGEIPNYYANPDNADPVAGGGWWLNVDGAWPSLARDAFAGLGAGHQCVLVVPSLDLVAVRLGRDLSRNDEDPLIALQDQLFDPLMRAVVGPGSRTATRHLPAPK